MANPNVRPKMTFYPEDAGDNLDEAHQGSRWLHEMDDDQLTPMIRLGTADYYIHEPAMLRDGSFCMPVRWFTRKGQMLAKAWELDVISLPDGDVWRVTKCANYEIPAGELLKNFVELGKDAGVVYSVPHPSRIAGMFPNTGVVLND